MASERRFKSWNVFDCGLVKDSTGHHLWETKALVEELTRRGDVVRLFTYKIAPDPEEFCGVAVTPTFSLFLYQSISNDPTWSTLENFIVHNRAFYQDLRNLDSTMFQESLALFPAAGADQLLGILRWLGSFAHDSVPNAAICLIPPSEWSQTNHTTGLYKTMWGDCSPELKKRIALFCRTPQIAERFAKHAGMAAQVLPLIVPQDIGALPTARGGPPEGPLMVSFVGGARRERGVALIPDVVKRCSESGVPFFVQARHGEDFGFDIATLTSLAGLPHVQMREGVLERHEYYQVIANSVSLLPYQAVHYVWRDSAVYHEAKMLGAPALVSAGTSMADEVAALGNGLVIKEHSVDGIMDCIAQAQSELPALRAAAARVREEFHRMQGVGRCVEAIESACAG